MSERVVRPETLDRSARDLEPVSPQLGSSPQHLTVQTKLSVGPAGDRYEREADAVADRVVAALRQPTVPPSAGAGQGRAQRMSARPVQRDTAPVAGRVQRMVHLGSDGGDVDDHTERAIRSAQAGGTPLPDNVRSTLEPAFGADFSGIRVHEGAQASALNERIQAKAFTTGNHVFFRDGLPDISQRDGQHLLAHELTHTLQQGAVGARAQRAVSVQRFLDPSQQAKLSKARADLAAILQTKKGEGKKAAARKKKIDDLRREVAALEAKDQATPEPTPALDASIAPKTGAPTGAGGGTASAQPTSALPVPTATVAPKVAPKVDAEPEAAAPVDPLVGTRASLLADLDAAHQRMVGIRGTATTALRARMPRGYTTTATDIDKIVGGLAPQATFDDYRARIQALTADEVAGATGAVAKIVEDFSDQAIQRRVEWWVGILNGLTTTQVTQLVDAATDDTGKTALRNHLLRVVGSRAEVGALRSYYRSKHDREENATYGMSFDLSNSPLAVHCHTAGSGTQITSVSLKHRNREGGAPVLSENWLGDKLASELVNGIGRGAENPRAVVLDIKRGARRAGKWSRPGLRGS